MVTKDAFYHRELDCLRFFAFFGVFLFHFFPQHPEAYARLGTVASTLISSCVLAGGLGVSLFFGLSSFLITTLLLREQESTGTIHVKAFWMRRILRIWPLYYFFIALTVFVVPLLLPDEQLSGWSLVGYLLFSGNWVCVVSGFPGSVASQLWSVSVEEQFYLLWPLILLAVGVRRLPHFALLCLVLGSVSRLIGAYLDLKHPAIWCNTFSHLDPIAMGALLAVFCIKRPYRLSGSIRLMIAAVCMIPIPMSFYLIGKSCFAGVASIWFYPMVSVCCMGLLIASYDNSGASTPWVRSRYLNGVVWLGRISYGLYVYHILAIYAAQLLFPLKVTGDPLTTLFVMMSQCVFSFAFSIVLAAISYEYLEKPFLRIKERFTFVISTANSAKPQSSSLPPVASPDV